MAAVTICSDFGVQKVSYYFHCFPIYLPWSDGTGCHAHSFLNAEWLFRGVFLDFSSWSWVGSGGKSGRQLWLSPERRGPTAGKAAVWRPGMAAAEPMGRALSSSRVYLWSASSLSVFTSVLWPNLQPSPKSLEFLGLIIPRWHSTFL